MKKQSRWDQSRKMEDDQPKPSGSQWQDRGKSTNTYKEQASSHEHSSSSKGYLPDKFGSEEKYNSQSPWPCYPTNFPSSYPISDDSVSFHGPSNSQTFLNETFKPYSNVKYPIHHYTYGQTDDWSYQRFNRNNNNFDRFRYQRPQRFVKDYRDRNHQVEPNFKTSASDQFDYQKNLKHFWSSSYLKNSNFSPNNSNSNQKQKESLKQIRTHKKRPDIKVKIKRRKKYTIAEIAKQKSLEIAANKLKKTLSSKQGKKKIIKKSKSLKKELTKNQENVKGKSNDEFKKHLSKIPKSIPQVRTSLEHDIDIQFSPNEWKYVGTGEGGSVKRRKSTIETKADDVSESESVQTIENEEFCDINKETGDTESVDSDCLVDYWHIPENVPRKRHTSENSSLEKNQKTNLKVYSNKRSHSESNIVKKFSNSHISNFSLKNNVKLMLMKHLLAMNKNSLKEMIEEPKSKKVQFIMNYFVSEHRSSVAQKLDQIRQTLPPSTNIEDEVKFDSLNFDEVPADILKQINEILNFEASGQAEEIWNEVTLSLSDLLGSFGFKDSEKKVNTKELLLQSHVPCPEDDCLIVTPPPNFPADTIMLPDSDNDLTQDDFPLIRNSSVKSQSQNCESLSAISAKTVSTPLDYDKCFLKPQDLTQPKLRSVIEKNHSFQKFSNSNLSADENINIPRINVQKSFLNQHSSVSSSQCSYNFSNKIVVSENSAVSFDSSSQNRHGDQENASKQTIPNKQCEFGASDANVQRVQKPTSVPSLVVPPPSLSRFSFSNESKKSGDQPANDFSSESEQILEFSVPAPMDSTIRKEAGSDKISLKNQSLESSKLKLSNIDSPVKVKQERPSPMLDQFGFWLHRTPHPFSFSIPPHAPVALMPGSPKPLSSVPPQRPLPRLASSTLSSNFTKDEWMVSLINENVNRPTSQERPRHPAPPENVSTEPPSPLPIPPPQSALLQPPPQPIIFSNNDMTPLVEPPRPPTPPPLQHSPRIKLERQTPQYICCCMRNECERSNNASRQSAALGQNSDSARNTPHSMYKFDQPFLPSLRSRTPHSGLMGMFSALSPSARYLSSNGTLIPNIPHNQSVSTAFTRHSPTTDAAVQTDALNASLDVNQIDVINSKKDQTTNTDDLVTGYSNVANPVDAFQSVAYNNSLNATASVVSSILNSVVHINPVGSLISQLFEIKNCEKEVVKCFDVLEKRDRESMNDRIKLKEALEKLNAMSMEIILKLTDEEHPSNSKVYDESILAAERERPTSSKCHSPVRELNQSNNFVQRDCAFESGENSHLVTSSQENEEVVSVSLELVNYSEINSVERCTSTFIDPISHEVRNKRKRDSESHSSNNSDEEVQKIIKHSFDSVYRNYAATNRVPFHYNNSNLPETHDISNFNDGNVVQNVCNEQKNRVFTRESNLSCEVDSLNEDMNVQNEDAIQSLDSNFTIPTSAAVFDTNENKLIINEEVNFVSTNNAYDPSKSCSALSEYAECQPGVSGIEIRSSQHLNSEIDDLDHKSIFNELPPSPKSRIFSSFEHGYSLRSRGPPASKDFQDTKPEEIVIKSEESDTNELSSLSSVKSNEISKRSKRGRKGKYNSKYKRGSRDFEKESVTDGIPKSSIKILDEKFFSRKLNLPPAHSGAILDIKVVNNLIFTASLDGTARLFDPASGVVLSTYQGHTGGVSCIQIVGKAQFTAGSPRFQVVTGSEDCWIYVYDGKTGSLTSKRYCLEPVRRLCYRWDTLFIATDGGSGIRWNMKDKRLGEKVQFCGKGITHLIAHVEGGRKVLVVAAKTTPIMIRDAISLLYLRKLEYTQLTVYSALFEGNSLYTAGVEKTICVYDYCSGNVKASIGIEASVSTLMIHSKYLIAVCYDSFVRFFKLPNGEFCHAINMKSNSMFISAIIFRNRILLACKNGEIVVCDLPDFIK